MKSAQARLLQPNGVTTYPNTFRVSALNLPRFLAKLAAVRAGSSDMRILCAGDSTTFGVGATFVTGSWVTTLVSRLATLAPTAYGLAAVQNTAAQDTRWTTGSGWAASTAHGFGGDGNSTCTAWFAVSGTSGNLTFAETRSSSDTYDVYYVRNSGFGTITVTATGGSPVVQSTAGTLGVAKVTVTAAAAATSNTVTIAPSGGDVYILGVEPRLAGTRQILVGMAGVSGSTSNGWATVGASAAGSIPYLRAFAPDVTLFCLGINDGGNSRPVTTYLANMRTLVNVAKESGDAFPMTFMPSNGTPHTTFEPGYVAGLIGGQLDAALADVYGAMGGTWAAANAAGYTADSLHPNASGYALVGNLVANAIVLIAPIVTPGAPTGLANVPGDTQVALSWTAPTVTGGAAITDYVVQYRTTAGPGAWNTFADGTSTSTSATVTGLTNGTSYDFQVAAVNSAGTGAFSATTTGSPVAPAAPDFLFSHASLPGTLSVQSGAFTVGNLVTCNASGNIVAVWVPIGTGLTSLAATVAIYASTGASSPAQSQSYTTNSSTGWQRVALPAAVAVTAGQQIVVASLITGKFHGSSSAVSAPFTSTGTKLTYPATGNGRYNTGATLANPATTISQTFWCDPEIV